jgi:hypothetical protein
MVNDGSVCTRALTRNSTAGARRRNAPEARMSDIPKAYDRTTTPGASAELYCVTSRMSIQVDCVRPTARDVGIAPNRARGDHIISKGAS